MATAAMTAPLFTAQQAALNELMTGMDADARWVLLLGARGSGKSTVIEALLDELRLAAATVAVFEGANAADVDQLLGGLRHQLGLPRKRTLLGEDRSIADIVASQSARRTPLVVVVDDADALSAAALKSLAGLAASALRTETACYVVLAGAPALGKSADRAWAKSGSRGASVRSRLGPMTPGEVHRHVEELTRSGGDARVTFSETAIQNLEMYGRGRPGLIGQLYARVVMHPATRLTNQVSADAVIDTAERLVVDEASGRSFEPERERGRRSNRSIARWAALIGTTTIAALLLYVGIYVGPRLIRAVPRLMATSRAWLGLSQPAVDRSTSEIVRAGYDDARREPARREAAVATARRAAAASHPAASPSAAATTATAPSAATATVAATTAPSSRQGREPRPAERTPQAVAVTPSVQQIAALMARARDGEVDELTRLITGGVSPNVRDATGFTPLMAAVMNDRVPAARVLLDRGAEINARARGGLTALMLGIINDRPDAVQLLLARGADTNAQTGAGWTALTFAAWKGDAALVRALLSHGARPNVIDKQGWRPLDYAPQKLTSEEAGARIGD